jgi:hypothetical protein
LKPEKAPSADFKSGLINVQQFEGLQAVAGFQIATPWDQLYTLSPSAPASEQKWVMNKAYTESLALSESERGTAVKVVMYGAFACILLFCLVF